MGLERRDRDPASIIRLFSVSDTRFRNGMMRQREGKGPRGSSRMISTYHTDHTRPSNSSNLSRMQGKCIRFNMPDFPHLISHAFSLSSRAYHHFNQQENIQPSDYKTTIAGAIHRLFSLKSLYFFICVSYTLTGCQTDLESCICPYI